MKNSSSPRHPVSDRQPIELRRLRYFLAVAEELHFGRAAERLHMAQPPLSEQIRKLEEELQAKLFERSSRNVALTEASRIFLVGARRAVEEVDRSVYAVQQAERGISGHLAMGFVSSVSVTFLPQLIRHLKQAIPDLQLDLRQYSTSSVIKEELLRRTLDIGLLRPPIDNDELCSHLFHRDPMIVAVPSGHALARRRKIRLQELKDEAFILQQQGNIINKAVQQLCLAAGFAPHPAQFVEDIYAMLGLVAAGLGIALVPGSLSSLKVDGLVFCQLANADVNSWFELSLVWHVSDQRALIKSLLLFELTAVDAWPLMGVPDLDEFNRNILVGEPVIEPRIVNVPVRMPLPPAPKQGSIYENQSGLKNRFFAKNEVTSAAFTSSMQ